MDNQKLVEYIQINHWFMTLSEMASELNIPHSTLKYECDKLGVTPITGGERAQEFIKAHSHLTLEEVAERLNVHPSTLYPHMRSTGITLETKFQRERRLAELKPKNKPAKTNIWSEDEVDYITSLSGYGNPNKQKIKRVPGVYNQTGSKFTDELRGIKTTDRIK